MQAITFYRGNDFAGKTVNTKHGIVTYVGAATHAEIDFRKYTADYSSTADKKFFVTATRRRYATLEAAAAAAVAARPQTTAA